jgi:hypothetical protein
MFTVQVKYAKSQHAVLLRLSLSRLVAYNTYFYACCFQIVVILNKSTQKISNILILHTFLFLGTFLSEKSKYIKKMHILRFCANAQTQKNKY